MVDLLKFFLIILYGAAGIICLPIAVLATLNWAASIAGRYSDKSGRLCLGMVAAWLSAVAFLFLTWMLVFHG